MKNTLKLIREKRGHTQSALAELTNLSVRTIQRLESGTHPPKGHTLKVLAAALEVDEASLLELPADQEAEGALRLKMINLAALSFIGLPFGNVVLPFLIWRKHRGTSGVDEVGRRIINAQIVWTLFTCALLILCPFVGRWLMLSFSLTLWVGLVAMALNVLLILRFALALNRGDYDRLPNVPFLL